MYKIISVLFIVTLCNSIDGFAFRKKNVLQPFVVNGTDTTIEAHPHQVSVRFFGSHVCGGSILTENLVLTAAHCLEPFSSSEIVSYYTIRVGATNRDAGIEYHLANGTYHENFALETYNNDVGLLRLVENLVFSANIAPIQLAVTGTGLPYGQDTNVTGWGLLYHQGPLATILQKGLIEVLDRATCVATYQSINPITDNMFCAGSFHGLVDSCNGDSGGPVVYHGVQIGIVSWGMECARYGFPGVYSFVAVLWEWIDETSRIL